MVNLNAFIKFGNGSKFYINSSNKKNINIDMYRTKNIGKIPWGIVSNIGEVSFKDKDGSIKAYIKSGALYGAQVMIYFSNTDGKYYEDDLIGTFYVSDVDYEDNISEVTVKLTDGLEGWQTIDIPAIYKYDAGTLYDVVIDCIGDSNYKKYFVPFDDYEAFDILSNIRLNSGINWEKSNLWNLMQKVCEASRCCLYMNNKGKAIIERPKSDRIIVVNPKNIYNISERQSAFSTKIPNAKISFEKRTDHYGENISSSIPLVFYSDEYPASESQSFVGTSKSYNSDIIKASSFLFDAPPDYPNQTEKKKTRFMSSMTLKCELKDTINKNTETMRGELTASRLSNYRYDENNVLTYDREEYVENIGIGYNYITKHLSIGTFWVSTFTSNDNSVIPFTLMKELSISGNLVVKGDYYQSDGTDEISYTQSASADFTALPSNDLILNTTTEGQSQLAKNNLNYVKNRFSKGLETAVLRCSMDNYYDTSNKLAISKDVFGKRTFKKYDIILPYTIKNGQKVPLSTYQNGQAKTFQVVGIRYSNQGTLWQDIYLEEYINI